MRAFLHAADQPWAITEAALEQILAIASRDNLDPQALAAKLGRPLQNTQITENRDGVAIIPIVGPIFQRANLFTEISGATSTEILARDFSAALTDPTITAIILDIDSPGGEVDGINELAQMIFDGRASKPIVAYVGAQAASGAYWLASQADEVVADDTARIGSIGTVVTMPEKPGQPGTREIVSSQSPLKRAGPDTPEGLAHIQGLIDDLAGVFISAVARGRGVTTEDVLANFGKGGQFVGQKAIDAGMADRLGSLEGVIAELSKGASDQAPALPQNLGGPAASSKGKRMKVKLNAADPKPAGAQDPEESDQVRCPNCGTMFDPSENAACDPAHVSGLVTKTVAGERTRIAAIISCDEAKGREALARTIALETETTPEAAKKLLASAQVAGAPATINPLAAAMTGIANPNVGTGAAADPANDDESEIAAVIAVMNKVKGAK